MGDETTIIAAEWYPIGAGGVVSRGRLGQVSADVREGPRGWRWRVFHHGAVCAAGLSEVSSTDAQLHATKLMRCVDLAAGAEREACAMVALSEPAFPSSPWKVYGFWRALRLMVRLIVSPVIAARVHVVMTREAIAKRIRARGEA